MYQVTQLLYPGLYRYILLRSENLDTSSKKYMDKKVICVLLFSQRFLQFFFKFEKFLDLMSGGKFSAL